MKLIGGQERGPAAALGITLGLLGCTGVSPPEAFPRLGRPLDIEGVVVAYADSVQPIGEVVYRVAGQDLLFSEYEVSCRIYLHQDDEPSSRDLDSLHPVESRLVVSVHRDTSLSSCWRLLAEAEKYWDRGGGPDWKTAYGLLLADGEPILSMYEPAGTGSYWVFHLRDSLVRVANLPLAGGGSAADFVTKNLMIRTSSGRLSALREHFPSLSHLPAGVEVCANRNK